MTVRLTFRKRDHIIKSVDFDLAFKTGRKASDAAMTIFVRRNDLEWSRIGLVVGKRHGNSPERNRLKRLLREAFRLNRDAIPAGVDIVVLPRVRRKGHELEVLARSLVALSGKACRKMSKPSE